MGGIIRIECDNNITKNQKKRLRFAKTNPSRVFFVRRKGDGMPYFKVAKTFSTTLAGSGM